MTITPTTIYSTAVGAVNTHTPSGDIAPNPAANNLNGQPTRSLRAKRNVSDDGNDESDDENLEGLYAAIAISIVCLIVILILVVVVVILCKKKHLNNAVPHSPRLYEAQDGQAPGKETKTSNCCTIYKLNPTYENVCEACLCKLEHVLRPILQC